MAAFHASQDPEALVPDWLLVAGALAKRPFIVGQAALGQVDGLGDKPVIEVTVAVNLPQDPRETVQETERVWLVLGPERLPPCAIAARPNFPALAHTLKIKLNGAVHRELCLFRGDPAEWWVGKTIPDAVGRAKQWLEDAAAGCLIKEDDPYEPMPVEDAAGVVLLDRGLAHTKLSKNGSPLFATSRPRNPSQKLIEVFAGDIRAEDIPTLIYRQPLPQLESWPRELDSVAVLRDTLLGFGLAGGRLGPWLAGLSREARRVLMLVGIARPKAVLGVEGDEEWIGYVLDRAQVEGGWSARPVWVLDALTPDLARRLSGWGAPARLVNVLLIGAGSFGASVADSLARSGLVTLRIVDGDLLLPHNTARHVLSPLLVGMNKAEALAFQLSFLFPRERSHFRAVPCNVLKLDTESSREMLKDVDLILDCSASAAVQRWISDLPAPRPRAICAFQVCAGRGTVALAESADAGASGVTVEALEAVLISAADEHPIIREWLAEETEPIQIGGGCRSVTARVPDQLARLGAAWVADSALRLINTGTNPTDQMIGISTVTTEPLTSVSTHWEAVPAGSYSESSGWRVWLSAPALEAVARFTREHHPSETAGVLLGRRDPRRRVIHVTSALPPPPGTTGSATACQRGTAGLAAAIAAILRRSNGHLHYAGEWHSHPPGCGVAMSSQDMRSATALSELLADELLPAVCVICNGEQHTVHVVTDTPGGQR